MIFMCIFGFYSMARFRVSKWLFLRDSRRGRESNVSDFNLAFRYQSRSPNVKWLS